MSNPDVYAYDVGLFDDLAASNDRNSMTQYSTRSIIKLISLQRQYRSEIGILEPHVHRVSRRLKIVNSLSTVLQAVATSGTVVELVREIVIRRDGSIEPSTLNLTVLIVMFFLQTIATLLMTRTSPLQKEISGSKDCITELHYIVNQIEQQIFCKDSYRVPIVDLMRRVGHDHARVIRMQTEALSVNFSSAVRVAETVSANLSSRRSSQMSPESSSDSEITVELTPVRSDTNDDGFRSPDTDKSV